MIANLQEILIKSTIINGEDFQSEIRYLTILVLDNLISRLQITMNYRFFLKYCIRMTKEDFPLRRACGFACMGKIVQLEQDINMICRTDLLQSIDWASKMTLQRTPKNDLSQDLQQALTTSTIVTRKLYPRLSMLIETKEGVGAVFRILSSVHEHLKCELLVCAYGKDKNFAALLKILGEIIERETHPFLEEYVVDQILSIISKDQEACFRCNDIVIIFNYLKRCPKVIVLIERISSTQEGTTKLFCVPECINSMCHILLGNSAFNALVVSRILSMYVIFGQISLIAKMSKKHVLLTFFKALSDDRNGSDGEFVRNVLHLIGHVLSQGNAEKLDPLCIQVIQQIKSNYKADEYVNMISTNIISHIKEKNRKVNLSEQLDNLNCLIQNKDCTNKEKLSQTLAELEAMLQIISDMDVNVQPIEICKTCPLVKILAIFNREAPIILITIKILHKIGTMKLLVDISGNEGKSDPFSGLISSTENDYEIDQVAIDFIHASVLEWNWFNTNYIDIEQIVNRLVRTLVVHIS